MCTLLFYFFFLCFFLVFFFQAEDGIRDLVRSRGLGDVYKRQVQALYRAKAPVIPDLPWVAATAIPVGRSINPAERVLWCVAPVSYTHLTLPTSDLV